MAPNPGTGGLPAAGRGAGPGQESPLLAFLLTAAGRGE